MLIEYGNTTVVPEWHLEEKQATGYSRVYYMRRGSVIYESRDETRVLKPGYLYVLPSAVPYTARRDGEECFSCTYMHIGFPRADVVRLIEMELPKDSCLYHYLRVVRTAIREGKTVLLERIADSFELFLRENDAYVQSSGMLATVRDYITEHISEEITVEQLSQLFSYHPNYFIRLFRQETGLTPHRFLLQQRMQYAVLLLNKGQDNRQIAEACGYTDPSTFVRAFRLYYGVTPLRYKNGYRRP